MIPKNGKRTRGIFETKNSVAAFESLLPRPRFRKPLTAAPCRKEEKKELVNFQIKPSELIAYLDQYVVRQGQAKSILATKICTHFNRIRHQETREDKGVKITGNIKSNILMLGPTGIGKTYLIKLIAKKSGFRLSRRMPPSFQKPGMWGVMWRT